MSALLPQSDVPDFDLRVNGGPVPPEALADIRSITAEEAVDALGMVTIELYNWDDQQLKVSWSDSAVFAVGNALEVSLGYVNDVRKVMTVEITGLEATFSASSPPSLLVRAHDYRHRLARDRRTLTYSKMKDSAIAAQIARTAGMRADVTDTKVTVEYVVQCNQTDLEFLRQRARLIGYEVAVSGKVLAFQPPRHANAAAATIAVTDVLEFTPRLSTLGQVGALTVRGWDAKQKAAIIGAAKTGQEASMMRGRRSGPGTANRAFGKSGGVEVDLPVRSKFEADQAALGRFNQMALTYIEGDLLCHGQPDLHAASVVDVTGAGTTFSGSYYVTSVTHSLTRDEGYRTSLAVRRNAS